jgi:hypothetical protein
MGARIGKCTEMHCNRQFSRFENCSQPTGNKIDTGRRGRNRTAEPLPCQLWPFLITQQLRVSAKAFLVGARLPKFTNMHCKVHCEL